MWEGSDLICQEEHLMSGDEAGRSAVDDDHHLETGREEE